MVVLGTAITVYDASVTKFCKYNNKIDGYADT